MKFARKLIHGGPVHPCYEPEEALQKCMVLSILPTNCTQNINFNPCLFSKDR